MKLQRLLFSVPLALSVSVFSLDARADVSSWFSVTSGVGVISRDQTVVSPLLEADLGLGTTPVAPWVLGGGFHFGALFGEATDWGGNLRLVTGSYVRGTWGIGLDLGSHYRWATAGSDAGGAQGSARILLGAPWGVVLNLGGSYGENNVGTFTASLGFDFARLTAHRGFWTDWFPSPLSSPHSVPPSR